MTTQRNLGALTGVTDPEDMTIGTLLTALGGVTDLPLVFSYDGRDINPGYHVTEVKAGRFEALDCGANPESWAEIFVQLWDVAGDRSHMTAGKFLNIIGKVGERVALDHHAKLTFEVSDGQRPIALHRAALPRIEGDLVRVELSPRPASCKPWDRGLRAAGLAPSGAQPCCG
ncbi:DUF6428 family protein [Paracoccus sp. (in: a-proteobacteria)]|uniref:DUF6428 family protein n=1 Tax=Paracoccus sp. TaxID=267 RepID=UPI0035B15142